jgi:phage terminase large subunit
MCCVTYLERIEYPMSDHVRFEPRQYQYPIIDAVESNGRYRRILAVLPRRAGKDIVGFNLALRWALREVCTVLYCFPTYRQAKDAVFDGITHEGKRFLDFIPNEIVKTTNSQDLIIKLLNGSQIKFVGTDHYDRLRGMSCKFAIFSEFADQSPKGYEIIEPMLRACKGTALFLSTPKGKNHMYRLHHDIALEFPEEWFVYHIGLNETKHLDEVEEARSRAQLSPDFFQQEYMCSYHHGVTGQFYYTELQDMRTDMRINSVPYLSELPVYTSWDLGLKDPACIIFFQVDKIGNVRIFDSYSDTDKGLDHFAHVLQSKGYTYAKHFFPHDIEVREQTYAANTRKSYLMAKNVHPIIVVPRQSLEEGIEMTKVFLKKCFIDEKKGEPVLRALENYRSEYDSKNDRYTGVPVKNFARHFSDALRYAAQCEKLLTTGTTADDIKQWKAQAYQEEYGGGMPTPFQQPKNIDQYRY